MAKHKEYPLKVLMVLHSAGLTGPNKATMSLIQAMDGRVCAVDVACPAAGALTKRLAAAGIRHIPLEFNGCSDVCTVLRLAAILRHGSYDIVHGHLGRVGPIVYTAGRIAGAATVLTEHMNDFDHSWLGKNPVRRFLHGCGHLLSNNLLDRVIAVSRQAGESYIRRQGIRPEKVAVIGNGIYFPSGETKADRRAVRADLGIDEKTVVVGTAARLIAVKGVGDFITAAAALAPAYPGVRFLVAGDGQERPALEQRAAQLGIREKLVFLGFRDDLERVYAAMDMFVQPSRKEMREAFGLAALEAMASRIPVIVSSGLSAGQVVDRVDGLVFEQDNPDSLACAIKTLLDDPGQAQRLAAAGYETARARFDARETAATTAGLYAEALLSKGCTLRLPVSKPSCVSCGGSIFSRSRLLWDHRPLYLSRCHGCGMAIVGQDGGGDEPADPDHGKFCVKNRDFLGLVFGALIDGLMGNRAARLRIPVPGRLLDAGCGDGRFLRFMASRGWECWGTDQFAPNRFAAAAAINYIRSPRFDFDHRSGYFDAVTFWHSFEHMADSPAVLKKTREMLADTGILYISVPNGESIEAVMSVASWLGLIPEHRFIFTERSLRSLLERNGFEVISCSKNQFEYTIPFFVQSMLNCLGGETNFLHNFFKRNRLSGALTARRIYTILLTSFLLPLLATAGLLLFAINAVTNNGEVLEMRCRKKPAI